MKKIIITLVAMMAITMVGAQPTLSGGGSALIQSRGLLPSVGFVFGESPSLNLNLYGDLRFKKNNGNGLSLYYSGFATFDGRSENHIIDLMGRYQVNRKITLSAGPELSLSYFGENYDKVLGVTIMVNLQYNDNTTSTSLVYSDKYGQYMVESLEFKVSEKLNTHSMIAYTNAEGKQFYGLLGGEFLLSNHLFVSMDVLIKENSSKFIFGVGTRF